MNAVLSEDIALRIGLAARVLPDTDPKRLMRVLDDAIGLPPSPKKLKALTVKKIAEALDGELSELPREDLKTAVAYLRGELGIGVDLDNLPEPKAYAEGDMPGSIRVAIASNGSALLDGHFGSCARFLIYQVSPEEIRLIDLRSIPSDLPPGTDKNAERALLIEDCHVLYVNSIGGPAAAKVVRKDIHPIKIQAPCEAIEILERLKETLGVNPPPWLAKVMGHEAESRIRFQVDEEEV